MAILSWPLLFKSLVQSPSLISTLLSWLLILWLLRYPHCKILVYLSEPPAVLDVRRITVHTSSAIICYPLNIKDLINCMIKFKFIGTSLFGGLYTSCRFITILTIVYHTLHCYNLFIKAILFYNGRDYFTCCSQISQYVTGFSIKSFLSLNYGSFIIDNNILHVAKSW